MATVIRSGLAHPWDLAFAPDGRMFVTERVGNILIYASASPGATQLVNYPVANINASGETVPEDVIYGGGETRRVRVDAAGNGVLVAS